jgi:hypothetical protein
MNDIEFVWSPEGRVYHWPFHEGAKTSCGIRIGPNWKRGTHAAAGYPASPCARCIATQRDARPR